MTLQPTLRAVPARVSHDPATTLLFDLQAEVEILSNALYAGEKVLAELPSTLTPATFYSEAHRRTFEACLELRASGKTVALVTVGSHLRDAGRLEQVGGAGRLTEILGAAPVHTPRTLRELADKLIERAGRRHTKALAENLAARCELDGEGLDRILDDARGSLDVESRALAASSDIPTATAVVCEAVASVRAASEGRSPAVATGFHALDELLSGGLRHELVVLGGRPSAGKTSLATQIALRAARAGVGVYVKPLEARADFMKRAIAARAGLRVDRVLKGRLEPDEWSQLVAASQEVSTMPLLVDKEEAVTGAQFCDRARRAQLQLGRAKARLGLVIVDYVQELLPCRARGTREQEVAENVRRLRDLPGQLGVVVLALAQLSRGDKLSKRGPALSDLRESGQIEQDARVVLLLSRVDRDAEVIVAKQNNGPEGTVRLVFDAPRLTFGNAPDGGPQQRSFRNVVPSPAAATAPKDDNEEPQHAFADLITQPAGERGEGSDRP